MGLTIHYHLCPPPRCDQAKARQLVMEAHRRTRRLVKRRGYGSVSAVATVEPDHPWLIQSILRRRGEETFGHSARPIEGWAFNVNPGPDCEFVTLGLCRYPASITYKGRSLKTPRPGWNLQSFCKTQYASLHGWDEFYRCHRLVIDVLLIWERLGVTVTITDEADYWPGRKQAALRANLNQMNRIVAGLGGALKDASDEGGPTVQSPIFAHPQFEILEAEGMTAHGAAIEKTVSALTRE